MADESLHSICRWTFNPGKGGFVPANERPDWGPEFSTVNMIELVAKEIAPRMPDNVQLGVEMHVDFEVNEDTAPAVADALVGNGLYLAMSTPGAHFHHGYGGSASLDAVERKAADELGTRTVDITYGPLKKAWHPDAAPSFVLWNGSWGYDVESPAIAQMKRNLRKSIADLVSYEQGKGGLLYKSIEPKGNEGHAAMLVATVGEALHLWTRLVNKYGISAEKLGVNQEFGHSQMIGLDTISEIEEEIEAGALYHMHLNSQGGEAGLLGGPAKFDIDNGAQITAANISIAHLIQGAGYARWKGHDMQPRAYDGRDAAVDRVVRSVLSWEACERAAAELDYGAIASHLAARKTAPVQDIMRHAVEAAGKEFDDMYAGK